MKFQNAGSQPKMPEAPKGDKQITHKKNKNVDGTIQQPHWKLENYGNAFKVLRKNDLLKSKPSQAENEFQGLIKLNIF